MSTYIIIFSTPSLAEAENPRQVIIRYLNELYETGKLREELYVELSLATALFIAPQIANTGHKKGLQRLTNQAVTWAHETQMSDEERLFCKSVFVSVFYYWGSAKGGKTLFFLSDKFGPTDPKPETDAQFVYLIRRQADQLNKKCQDEIGFHRINAGDIQFSKEVVENEVLRRRYRVLAKKANTILGCILFEFCPPMSGKTRKRLEHFQKNFKFIEAGLENLDKKWPYSTLEEKISIPYGTPNCG